MSLASPSVLFYLLALVCDARVDSYTAAEVRQMRGVLARLVFRAGTRDGLPCLRCMVLAI